MAVVSPTRRRLVASPGAWLVWGAVAFFLINLAGVVGSVLVSSFGTKWFGTWFPEAFTVDWYGASWTEFKLLGVIGVTLQVSLLVVLISVLIGVPAAYVLARRTFPGKRLVMLVFLLPILTPPITYAIPLTTALLRNDIVGVPGVVLANLVPSVPFVILTMTPFIEQINPSIESAARMCGAGVRALFLRVLGPLLVPGILAASILVLVRTVGMFELTFFASTGPDSNTLVVELFGAMNAAGIRAQQSVDAMAVIYTSTMLVLLVIALRFVNPTQLVARVKETPEP